MAKKSTKTSKFRKKSDKKPKKKTPARNKKTPARKSAAKKRLERKLEVGLEESFPGSDPVAVTDPTRGEMKK
jgi:hypothetical protein